MHAWQIYLEEFRRRGERAGDQRSIRDDILAEAAHDAYQAAADRMVRDHGWSDGRTLVVMRGLNEAVKTWLRAAGTDWDALAADLQRREQELTDGFPGGA